jgi:hypothetical protein
VVLDDFFLYDRKRARRRWRSRGFDPLNDASYGLENFGQASEVIP